MSESKKFPGDLEEALFSASPDERIATPAETPRSIKEAIEREIDRADIMHNPDMQKTPTELYETLLKPHLHDAITALGLYPIIHKCKAIIERANFDNRARSEKKVAKILMKAFNKKQIPFSRWSFFPEAMAIEGSANCSGCALLYGVIMNEELGVETEYANPIGHAANLVTFCDNSTYYFDPRNQVIQKLSLGKPVQEREGFKIYDIKRFGLEYQYLPVSDLKHGATLTLLENLNSLESAWENDAEAKRVIEEYREDIDFDFAREYMKGKFLTVREGEDEWIEEEKYKQAFRNRSWYYFLIPNH